MTLEDLLDELRTGILRDTSDRASGSSDQLWSDTRLIRYIDRAQYRFARKSCVLRSIMSFQTVGLQRQYDLDPGVFAVLSARFMGNGDYVNGIFTLSEANALLLPLPALIYPDQADLGRGGHATFDALIRPDTRWFDVNTIAGRQPARPMAFDTDEFIDATNGVSGTMSMRLYPTPDVLHAGCTVMVRVVRLPANPLTPQNLAAVPEIPEDYHLDLLDYAAYLALRIVDHEAGDADRSQDFLNKFEAKCEEARRDMLRKMFTPMAWGFGSGAFTYESN